MKDCHERRSFVSREDAKRFLHWLYENHHTYAITIFECRRCHRFHLIGNGIEGSVAAQRRLQPAGRCLSDKDIHLQIARFVGCSLDELQTRVNLGKVSIKGDGCEIVRVKKRRKPYDRPEQI